MADATETADQTTEELEAVDAATLGDYLDEPYGEIRAGGRELLSRPEFAPVASGHRHGGVPAAGSRSGRPQLAEEGHTTLGFPTEYGGGGDIGGSIASFETLALGDLSLLVKCGVQFGLFGGAILHLGTKTHHEKYLYDIAKLKLPGCFAMSETSHGSDVQEVRTTATYDLETEEWVIETPTERDRKDWIGNAAEHGRAAVVFAQLMIGDDNHGVHAFVVPLRDERGKVARRRPDRGLRPQARPQRRRQRPHLLRRHPHPAHQPARPLRLGHRARPLHLADRELQPAASSRWSARSSRAASRSPAAASRSPRWR